MRRKRDDRGGKDRSWWTAVGLFTTRMLLFSRCLAADGGNRREREREEGTGTKEKERDRAKKGWEWRFFGGGCQF